MKYGGSCNLSLTAHQATKPLTYGLRTFMNRKPRDAAPAARVSGTERPMPNPWPAHSFPKPRRDWPYLGQFFCCAKVLKSLTVIAITLISQTYKIWFGKGKLVIISNNSLGFISTYHRVLLEVIIHFYWKLYIYTYSFYILQYIGRMKHRL